ncbi:hypothetical protein M5K25_026159 [Dendrobium thyrsiflorum]|uniref:Uncharacterized protein n=1 Tax=Dendrobium thyrsiflorum TaxID=117978 RepID=A0ABD0TWR1_DENTH
MLIIPSSLKLIVLKKQGNKLASVWLMQRNRTHEVAVRLKKSKAEDDCLAWTCVRMQRRSEPLVRKLVGVTARRRRKPARRLGFGSLLRRRFRFGKERDLLNLPDGNSEPGGDHSFARDEQKSASFLWCARPVICSTSQFRYQIAPALIRGPAFLNRCSGRRTKLRRRLRQLFIRHELPNLHRNLLRSHDSFFGLPRPVLRPYSQPTSRHRRRNHPMISPSWPCEHPQAGSGRLHHRIRPTVAQESGYRTKNRHPLISSPAPNSLICSIDIAERLPKFTHLSAGEGEDGCFFSRGKGPKAITGGNPGTTSPALNAVINSGSKAKNVLTMTPFARISARPFSINWVVKRWFGSRRGGGTEEYGILRTPPAILTSVPMGWGTKGETEQRASMEANEMKKTKQGMFAATATGRKVEAMVISMMRDETGGDKVEMREGRRWAERRMASHRSVTGSEDSGKREGSNGARGKSMRRDDGREERRLDSAAVMVGRTVRREMEMPRSESALARRTNGLRWPMPELGKRRT